MSHTAERICALCVWWSGDAHAAAHQLTARCEQYRTRTYADDICTGFRDALTARRSTGMEPIGPIVARVIGALEPQESEAA